MKDVGGDLMVAVAEKETVDLSDSKLDLNACQYHNDSITET